MSLHLSVPELVPFPSGLKITSVSCGGMCSFAVVERTGEVYTWGQTVGSEKEPARSPVRVPGVRGVSSLVAGMFHALALQEDGRVMSWGNGDYGQLGLGRPGSFDTPTEVEALSRAVRFYFRVFSVRAIALTSNHHTDIYKLSKTFGRRGSGPSPRAGGTAPPSPPVRTSTELPSPATELPYVHPYPNTAIPPK